MITVTYSVRCDAADIDVPDESCEAEFEHTASGHGDSAGLRRQLTARGWTYRAGRFTCPLHRRSRPAEGEEAGS